MPQTLWIATSKFGNSIRLTEKVWSDKLLREHPEFSLRPEYLDELRQTIEEPGYIVEGWQQELLALRWCEIAPKNPKYLCVVYREYDKDGKLLRRKLKWPQQIL